jgi:Uma2 family endonuclease
MTDKLDRLFTVEEFLTLYSYDLHYELIDGELRDLEPSEPHEAVGESVAGRIYAEISRTPLNWFIFTHNIICSPTTPSIAFRPDVIVLDSAQLKKEPRWQQEPVICNGESIKLVVEVVSTNWQDDYARKVEEYALLRIPEYWIIYFRGLGGWQFIGKPKQPTFTLCQLVNDTYQQQQYRLGDEIASPLLPDLQLKLDDLLNH